MTGADEFNQAVRTYRRGDSAGAARSCGAILERHPDHAAALNLLAVVQREKGELADAAATAERAVSLRPTSASFRMNLGNAYRALGRLEEAIRAYHQSLELARKPEALGALGYAYARLRRYEEAIEALDESARFGLRPVATYDCLSYCLARVAKWKEAIDVWRRAVELDPANAVFHSRLAGGLLRYAQLTQAIESFHRAVELNPRDAFARCGLAVALNQLGRWAPAAEAARQALAIDHRNPAAHSQLGIALEQLGSRTDAAAELNQALAMLPDDVETLAALGNLELARLNHTRAIEMLRRATASSKRSPGVYSNLLMALNYAPEADEQSVVAEHRRWAECVITKTPSPARDWAGAMESARPLRIGYISSDFRDHSIARFIEPVFERHDANNFPVTIFSNVRFPDAVTVQLCSLAEKRFQTHLLNDEQFAELVLRERIDILVDLAGHTSNNRLALFARRLAAVQVTYLAYPNTTGLPRESMQYRLTDSIADPPGVSDEIHTESPVRLPHCFLCYKAPDDAPPVAAAPCARNGHVTFGCFNAMPKLSGWLIELWAALLVQVPEARLIIKNGSLDDEGVCEDIRQRFACSGIGPARVTLLPHDKTRSLHLQKYAQVDIALDTFPYNGTTTTCEALWMGVPVVTLAGSVHRSRVGASLLTNIGLTEFIAKTHDDYVRVASEMAAQTTYLADLRRGLRQRMRESRLMDARGFTRDLEDAYRWMWQKACASGV